jgi:hypothetical protein
MHDGQPLAHRQRVTTPRAALRMSRCTRKMRSARPTPFGIAVVEDQSAPRSADAALGEHLTSPGSTRTNSGTRPCSSSPTPRQAAAVRRPSSGPSDATSSGLQHERARLGLELLGRQVDLADADVLARVELDLLERLRERADVHLAAVRAVTAVSPRFVEVQDLAPRSRCRPRCSSRRRCGARTRGGRRSRSALDQVLSPWWP